MTPVTGSNQPGVVNQPPRAHDSSDPPPTYEVLLTTGDGAQLRYNTESGDFEFLDANGDPLATTFAHLIEDAEHSRLQSDWSIRAIAFQAASDLNPDRWSNLNQGSIGAGGHPSDTEVWFVYDTTGDQNYAVLSANGNGSLHWGNGTDAPDISFARYDEDGTVSLGLNEPGLGFRLVSASGQMWYLTVDNSGTLVITPGPM